MASRGLNLKIVSRISPETDRHMLSAGWADETLRSQALEFEPTMTLTRHNGFKTLCHPSRLTCVDTISNV